MSNDLSTLSLSLPCHCFALSAHCPPLALRWSYCIIMKTSSLSSSCRVGAEAWRLLPPPLLLRSVRAGREALAGGGPREEDEWEEDEGKGATVALTLLLAPSWRPWFCGWKETAHDVYTSNRGYRYAWRTHIFDSTLTGYFWLNNAVWAVSSWYPELIKKRQRKMRQIQEGKRRRLWRRWNKSTISD